MTCKYFITICQRVKNRMGIDYLLVLKISHKYSINILILNTFEFKINNTILCSTAE